MNYLKERVEIILLIVFVQISLCSYSAGERTVIVKLRGVYESGINVMAFDGVGFTLPAGEIAGVKPGVSVKFTIPEQLLPGEFLFRFEYREKTGGKSLQSEIPLIINKEDISVEANPQYLQGDSLRLVNDRENAAWSAFTVQNTQKRGQLGLLDQLCTGYTDHRSKVYRAASEAFEKGRVSYNQWLDSVSGADAGLYVSHLFQFQRLPEVKWEKSKEERIEWQADHWFDGFSFMDTLCLRSRQMNDYINSYVNLFGIRATDEQLRDSLFTRAGRMACDMASSGTPRVYGWMVDYFYRGYEAYNIERGLKMLGKYINDPRCMTSRKQEITRRLKGMKSLVRGSEAANLVAEDGNGLKGEVDLKAPGREYRLVVFYDSDCSHCKELLGELRKWYEEPQNQTWFSIYTIALDEREETWKKAHAANNFPWADLYAPGGVNSQVASDYYVLSTPNLFVVDKNGKLAATPSSVQELDKFLNGEDKN